MIPQLEFVKESLTLKPYAVMADSEYDSATIIEYIVKNLVQGQGSPETQDGAPLLPQGLPPLECLSVLPALRCFPVVSGGIESRTENVISLSVP